MASSLALSALAQDSSSSSSSSSSTTASSADVTATTTTTSAPSINNAETTITALFGSATTGFVGSVVSANPCETTLAVVCDSEDPNPVDVCVLVPDVTATVILGPSAYAFIYATSTAGGLITIAESCDLDGPSGSFTGATCTASVYASIAGVSTSSATVATITDDAEFFSYAPVPITAGASSLPTAGATCDAEAAAAATQTERGDEDAERTSSAGAVPTARVGEVLYKILVPVGAAVVAAGAGGLV
ncbi:hypothetical protein SMMN14_03160 [Sphaerulina musiva]